MIGLTRLLEPSSFAPCFHLGDEIGEWYAEAVSQEFANQDRRNACASFQHDDSGPAYLRDFGQFLLGESRFLPGLAEHCCQGLGELNCGIFRQSDRLELAIAIGYVLIRTWLLRL